MSKRKLKTVTVPILVACVMLLSNSIVYANKDKTVALSAANSTCASGAARVFLDLDASDATASIQVTGTFSGTVSFEASSNGGQSYAAIGGIAWADGTTVATSTTATGGWTFDVASRSQVCARISSYSSGTAVITITSSPTKSARNSIGKGLTGGGGGSGDASTNTATSIDGEIALFSGTGGKTFKRATNSGIVEAASGVYGTTTVPTITSFANATHTHANAAGGGTIAESVLTFTDITTNNVSTSKHGFVPKLSGNSSECLLGDGTFGTCGAGGGNVTGPMSSTDRAIATYSGTGGNALRNNSGVTIDASGNLTANTFVSSASGVGHYYLYDSGGTNYVDLTPTTLGAVRTATFPDANTNIPIIGYYITFAGMTAARTYTLPDTTATMSYTVASGAKAMATTLVSANSCSTAVTDTATGGATTDTVILTYASDPTGITGYGGGTAGGITIRAYVTANTVNFKRCNETGSDITPGALTINWRIIR